MQFVGWHRFSKIKRDVCRHAVDFLGHESVNVVTLNGDKNEEVSPMRVETTTNNRKAMAYALAERLGTECRYMGTPTYAYRVRRCPLAVETARPFPV